jgi:hypothetical protein
VTVSQGDLYTALGVRPGASAVDLRRAYDWCMSTEHLPERRRAAQDAYAVLGDPRLRSQYDRGQVVGVGLGRLHQSPSAASADARRGFSPGRQAGCRRGPSRPSVWSTGSGRLTPQAVCLTLAGLVLACLVALSIEQLRLGPDTAGPGSVAAALPPAAVPPIAALPRPPATGACFSPDGGTELRSREPVSCNGPHLFETIKNVHVVPSGQADTHAADVCLREFSSFTGLLEPAEDLWPTSVLTTGGGAAQLTCLVVSRTVRVGTAAGIAG